MATDVPLVAAAAAAADGERQPPSVVQRWTVEELFSFSPIRNILWSERSRTSSRNAVIDSDTF